MGHTTKQITPKARLKGGIHPPENKFAASAAIITVPIPPSVSLFLAQHIGAPAKPIVAPKDIVKVGDVLAEAGGFVSASIHASVSGTVKKIEEITDIDGYKKVAITIETDGDVWRDDIDRSATLVTDITTSPEEIIKKIEGAGLVGLGGAAFPSHVKLAVPQGKTIEYLIINAAECEPFITADHRLMFEKTPEIIVGIDILLKASRAKHAIIGIEDNKPDVIAKLRDLLKDRPHIQIGVMPTRYPQGGERQLIKTLLNREVPPPPNGLPIDVGCVVYNVGTVFAVYEAVQKNKPLIERVLSVTGKTVSRPTNVLVRIGTPLTHILEAIGGPPDDVGKVVSGGPMMGKAIQNIDTVTIKGMSCLFMMPQSDANRQPPSACIRCGRCVSVCTLGLEPYLLMAASEKHQYDRAQEEGIVNCCDCGCCSYICPANRPLLDFIRKGKSVVLKKMRQAQAKK